ncbi:MAG: hypothetical protein QOG03_1725 [Actinomycetota bacterium]|jgi:hypothetical protein|nr:hypothetical protein [Actinomycetota bacterium]
MTQPEYVPLRAADRVRVTERLPVPDGWVPDRPAELLGPSLPKGHNFGSTGPDAGYGLRLAERFRDRLELQAGESADDAVAGCFAVGSKRAAMFGRAPVIFDYQLAFTLWGFLGGAPAELLAIRKSLFPGCSHHYSEQRDIVDTVQEDALRKSPDEVKGMLPVWRSLVIAD